MSNVEQGLPLWAIHRPFVRWLANWVEVVLSKVQVAVVYCLGKVWCLDSAVAEWMWNGEHSERSAFLYVCNYECIILAHCSTIQQKQFNCTTKITIIIYEHLGVDLLLWYVVGCTWRSTHNSIWKLKMNVVRWLNRICSALVVNVLNILRIVF